MAHSSSLAKMKSPQTTAIEALQRRTDTARYFRKPAGESRLCGGGALQCNGVVLSCLIWQAANNKRALLGMLHILMPLELPANVGYGLNE